MGDPRHMDGGGDVSSDAAFDEVVVSAAELTGRSAGDPINIGEVFEHLAIDVVLERDVDRDMRIATLEAEVRALRDAVRSLQLASEAGHLPHSSAPAHLDGTLRHPPSKRIPDAFPPWPRRTGLTAAEQVVEWFESHVMVGEDAYPPMRLWTQEARDAAGWRGDEGSKLGHLCKAYYRVRAVLSESPAHIDLSFSDLRKDPALLVPGRGKGKDWWSMCVAWYAAACWRHVQ